MSDNKNSDKKAENNEQYKYRVFVSNVDCKKFNLATLNEEFSKYGTVVSCYIVPKKDKDSNNRQLVGTRGWVVFNDVKCVEKVLKNADDDGNFETSSGTLYVDRFVKNERKRPATRGVFIRNVPLNTTWGELKPELEKYGKVVRVFVKPYQTIASVIFEDSASAAKLIDASKKDNTFFKFKNSNLTFWPYRRPSNRNQ